MLSQEQNFAAFGVEFSFFFGSRLTSVIVIQVSERDDKLLAEHMAKLRLDNEEVSGDEDSEEEEDTGMGEVDVENQGAGITDWPNKKKKKTWGLKNA